MGLLLIGPASRPPWIDQLDAGMNEIICVARRDRCAVSKRDRGYIAVGRVHRFSNGVETRAQAAMGVGGRSVEDQKPVGIAIYLSGQPFLQASSPA